MRLASSSAQVQKIYREVHGLQLRAAHQVLAEPLPAEHLTTAGAIVRLLSDETAEDGVLDLSSEGVSSHSGWIVAEWMP